MKLFLVLFSLFIVGAVCESDEDSTENEVEMAVSVFFKRLPGPIRMAIQNSLELKSNRSAEINEKCPNIGENFKKAVESAVECGDETDPSLSVCTALKTRFMICFAPVINVTENCMPQKSKGVPTLISKSVVSTISYLCGLTGEQMFEFFNDCMMDPTSDEDKIKTKEMENKMKKIKEDLTVKNMCSIGPEIKTLMNEYLRKACSSKMTQDVLIGLIDAVLKPCTTINEV